MQVFQRFNKHLAGWGSWTRQMSSAVPPPQVPEGKFDGNAFQFRENAVKLILDSRAEYGDFFQINFFKAVKMNILMNPHHLQDFHTKPEFSFKQIHTRVTKNVFHFEIPKDFNLMRSIGKAPRDALKKDVFHYDLSLEDSFKKLTQKSEKGWHREYLNHFLKHTQFRANFNCIFGNSDDKPLNYDIGLQALTDVHYSFNPVWLGVPRYLFGRTRRAWKAINDIHPSIDELIAREDCSSYLKNVMIAMKEANLSRNIYVGHNMIYLHVSANTKKLLYWAMNTLLKDPEVYKSIKEEVDGLIKSKDKGDGSVCEIDQAEVSALPKLDSFMKETSRISSGNFVIRYITDDTTFDVGGTTYDLKKGHYIAVYPPALHHDPLIYDNNKEFVYDRFVGKQVYYQGKPVEKPILPYGLICPGVKLSHIQFKWFIFKTLQTFDLDVSGPLAEFDLKSYGNEVLTYKQDIIFKLKVRDDMKKIKLV